MSKMIVKTLLLLAGTLINQARIIPRCYTDFHFNHSRNKSNIIYQKSWQRNCSSEVAHICRQNITIAYLEMPPFTNNAIFTKFKLPTSGVLQQILSVALAQCCGNCITIKFKKVKDHAALTDVKTKAHSDVQFPILTQGDLHQINASLPPLTIPVLHLPGAMFITKSLISAKVFTKEVLEAILDIWPLLGVSLLLAFAAGVVIWIVDTWWNKEHFPRRFFTGSFEGFWWAFISMTTVGYGDRTPRSIPGRLFAVFWILCGITITALMTAALTTAISVVTQRQKASLDRGTVGILKDHIFEKKLLLKGNAYTKYHNTVSQLVAALSNDDIEAILLDSLTAKSSNSELFTDNDIYLDNVIPDYEQSYLGITINEESLHSLLNEYMEFQQDAIAEFTYNVFRSFDAIRNKKVVANMLFTSNSGLFWPTMYACLVILGAMLLVGGTYELHRRRKMIISKTKVADVTLRSIKQEESRFEDELKDLLKTWEKRLLDGMKGYSLRGVFSKTNKTHANILIKLIPYDSERIALPDIDNDDNFVYRKKKKTQTKQKREIPNGFYNKLPEDYDEEDDLSTRVTKKVGTSKPTKVKKLRALPQHTRRMKKAKRMIESSDIEENELAQQNSLSKV